MDGTLLVGLIVGIIIYIIAERQIVECCKKDYNRNFLGFVATNIFMIALIIGSEILLYLIYSALVEIQIMSLIKTHVYGITTTMIIIAIFLLIKYIIYKKVLR